MSNFPDFVWALGEESSDPIVISGGSTVRVDELTASNHLAQQNHDLSDVRKLGVTYYRYGMPWRLSEPSPGTYDWRLWDNALAACEQHGTTPIVDLCHFGLPDHFPGFADPSWVDAFGAYLRAFCDRFPDVTWFTPVNEPNMTALMSGRYGMWNDRLATDVDYAQIAAHCVLANVEAHAYITTDRNGWTIGAEAISIPLVVPVDPVEQHRLALERATFDLTYGKDLDPCVEPIFDHVDPHIMERIAAAPITANHIAGHDFYPISVINMPDDVATILDAYEAWATNWYQRYQMPFWIAETSNLGLAVARQSEWLDALAARLKVMRTKGLPIRGLCWYSRGDQFDWQTALVEPTGALTEVGLFKHDRTARPAAKRFAHHAQNGAPRAQR